MNYVQNSERHILFGTIFAKVGYGSVNHYFTQILAVTPVSICDPMHMLRQQIPHVPSFFNYGLF